jgi:proline iminopeptidase
MKSIITLLGLFILMITATAADNSFYFTTSDNVQLYVRVAGKGQPCLFVHGGPGSTSHYFEAMPSAKQIEQQVQMIYFDQRGSGRSESATNGNYSIERMTMDFEELRQFLKIKKWHVMGHSFAGIMITDYAIRHPKSISSLLYIHATINVPASIQSHISFGVNKLQLTDSIYIDSNTPAMQKLQKVHEALHEKGIWYMLMFRNACEKIYSDSVTNSIGNFNHEFSNRVFNDPQYMSNMSHLTKQILQPVFIMTGDQDYAIGLDHYKLFLSPNKKVVHYIGGHAAYQEEPQWFSEKVLDFIMKNKNTLK